MFTAIGHTGTGEEANDTETTAVQLSTSLVRTRFAIIYKYDADKSVFSSLKINPELQLGQHTELTTLKVKKATILCLRVKKQMNKGPYDFPVPILPKDPALRGSCIGYLASDGPAPLPIYTSHYHTIPLLPRAQRVYSETDVRYRIPLSGTHHTAVRYLVNTFSPPNPMYILNDALIADMTLDPLRLEYLDALIGDLGYHEFKPNCEVKYITNANVIRVTIFKQLQRPTILVASTGSFERIPVESLIPPVPQLIDDHLNALDTLYEAMTGVTNQDPNDSNEESDSEDDQPPPGTLTTAAYQEWYVAQQHRLVGLRGRARETVELQIESEWAEKRTFIYANSEERVQLSFGQRLYSVGHQQLLQVQLHELGSATQLYYHAIFELDGHSELLDDCRVRANLREYSHRISNSGSAVLVGSALDAEHVLLYNELRELLLMRKVSRGDPIWRELHSTFSNIDYTSGYGEPLDSATSQRIQQLHEAVAALRPGPAELTVRFILPEDLLRVPSDSEPSEVPVTARDQPLPKKSRTIASKMSSKPPTRAIVAKRQVINLVDDIPSSVPVTVVQPYDPHWHVKSICQGTTLAAFRTTYTDPLTRDIRPVPRTGRQDGYHPHLVPSNGSVYLQAEDRLIPVTQVQDGWSELDGDVTK